MSRIPKPPALSQMSEFEIGYIARKISRMMNFIPGTRTLIVLDHPPEVLKNFYDCLVRLDACGPVSLIQGTDVSDPDFDTGAALNASVVLMPRSIAAEGYRIQNLHTIFMLGRFAGVTPEYLKQLQGRGGIDQSTQIFINDYYFLQKRCKLKPLAVGYWYQVESLED